MICHIPLIHSCLVFFLFGFGGLFWGFCRLQFVVLGVFFPLD